MINTNANNAEKKQKYHCFLLKLTTFIAFCTQIINTLKYY